MTDWLKKVAHGDFAAIPWNPTFREASELALLIDGYEVAGGVKKCMAISSRVADDMLRMGRTRASALDIWIALFGQQRAHRFAGCAPTDDDEHLFQELVRVLRMALKDLTPKQRAGIMSMMRSALP
jgi:hypothetical protein